MKDKVYIDTNILVYLYSDDIKSKVVGNLVDNEFDNILLSTQVINELVNVLAYKLKVKTKEEAKEIIRNLMDHFEISIITNQMISNAIDISIKYNFRYFDSLMISCALQRGCKILYSEDFQDRQIIENQLTIINPFRQ